MKIINNIFDKYFEKKLQKIKEILQSNKKSIRTKQRKLYNSIF